MDCDGGSWWGIWVPSGCMEAQWNWLVDQPSGSGRYADSGSAGMERGNGSGKGKATRLLLCAGAGGAASGRLIAASSLRSGCSLARGYRWAIAGPPLDYPPPAHAGAADGGIGSQYSSRREPWPRQAAREESDTAHVLVVYSCVVSEWDFRWSQNPRAGTSVSVFAVRPSPQVANGSAHRGGSTNHPATARAHPRSSRLDSGLALHCTRGARLLCGDDFSALPAHLHDEARPVQCAACCLTATHPAASAATAKHGAAALCPAARILPSCSPELPTLSTWSHRVPLRRPTVQRESREEVPNEHLGTEAVVCHGWLPLPPV